MARAACNDDIREAFEILARLLESGLTYSQIFQELKDRGVDLGEELRLSWERLDNVKTPK